MKKYSKFLIILIVLMIGAFYIEPDDKELFMAYDVAFLGVKPNVVVLMDNSGSMNNAIFYPKYGVDGIANTPDDGFDPVINYSGSVDSAPTYISQTGWYARWIINGNARQKSQSDLENWDGKHFWTGCFAGDGSLDNFQSGSYGWDYFREGDKVLFRDTSSPYYSAVATLKRKYQKDGNPWFELEDIEGGPITVNGGYFQQSPDGENWEPVIVKLYGTLDMGNQTRYDYDYLQWLFIQATDAHREAVSHFSTYGTFDLTENPPPEEPNDYGDADWEKWWVSDCVTPGHDRIKYRFTRIQVAREVICRVARMSNETVNLGLFRFDGSNGGFLMDSIVPSNDLASDLVAYNNMVADIAADSWTPLAEALADVWKYHKPGPSGEKDYWPVNYVSPVHDIEHWCQGNYVIIMTDGESTMDRFTGDGRFSDSMFTTKPVKRTKTYTTFEEWLPEDGWGDFDINEGTSGVPDPYDPSGSYCPNYTCWYTDTGSDYLDDVAYFMRHQDLFPDEYFGTDEVDGWPGDQNIYTYTVGFTIDNDLLRDTAQNGDGAYYTANNYDELAAAFQNVITGILLRNFAFSAITAPKKTATATNEDLTISYIGYFMPSQGNSLWDGHLLAYELIDQWGFDADGSDGITTDEFVYDTKYECRQASNGEPCERFIDLSSAHKWDAAEKLPDPRNLYTYDLENTTNIAFTDANKATLKPLLFEDKWGFDADDPDDGVTADEYVYDTEADCLANSGGESCYSWLENGCATCDMETDQIISILNGQIFSDIFHSDVGFIGSPSSRKKYVRNINPLDQHEDSETFAEFYDAHKDRRRVLFAGTNDGIFHMFNADDVLHEDEREAGVEVWGFIPDEVLLSLRKIVIDDDHTYTVDGRLSAEDIYYNKGSDEHPSWSTILVFGLRRGGNAYYALDITEYTSEPSLLWKFKDDTYSGESWGKAAIGKILIEDPEDSTQIIEKWIAVLPGGFAFNEENSTDLRGKAVFVVDASNGELLWMTGYHPDGDDDDTDNKLLTDSELFNFPIPSAFTLIDMNNNGYADTIYFGNLGGHLFKTDISNRDLTKWETVNLFKTDITHTAESTITSISGDQITVVSKVFSVGARIRGQTSNAQGFITEIANKVLTVSVDAGTFEEDETIVTRSYDPIYLSPALHYNSCYQRWISFGTGDRDRPRTNPEKGHLISIRDNGIIENLLANLDDLSSYWDEDILSIPEGEGLTAESNGWYFEFPDDSEKLFDPELLILPDKNLIPNILFNTYQPPSEANTQQIDNPCAIPSEGVMVFYRIPVSGCTIISDDGGGGSVVDQIEQVGGTKDLGRIAGGGMYGNEFLLYTSTSGDVASVPGGEDPGGGDEDDTEEEIWEFKQVGEIIYWKVKNR